MTNFSKDSRVWIYQANRQLSSTECDYIQKKADAFIREWTSHGKSMKAKLDIVYNIFLIWVLDETDAAASGCGIDKSVHFMQQLDQELKIDAMNRTRIAYKEGQEILQCSMQEFSDRIKKGILSSKSIVFNNMVQNLFELETNWETSAQNSWHAKLIS